ncbi:MAG: ABC transporter ATP-binding protein [Eggerthellaceae bacterium]|nr:ABC transporter ATP-binding protein [Eggerthellaceae bacterium]
MSIELENVACGYVARRVLENVSAKIEPGQVFCLLGPNGVGKTTLFKTMLGLLEPLGGRLVVEGQELASYTQKELARVLAYVPQAHTPPFAFTVRDVVVMGCAASDGLFGSPTRADYVRADETLELLGIAHLSRRAYTELSGGERQMALIARAVAQRPRYLMMDEPCASLDFGNEARVLGAVRSLAETGLGVVMTTHSPHHLAQCDAHGMLIMRDGSYLRGSAEELLTAENLERAYRVPVAVHHATCSGRSLTFCQPLV